MFKKLAQYGAALIAIYLIVDHGTNAGTVMTKGASGGATIIHALQGR